MRLNNWGMVVNPCCLFWHLDIYDRILVHIGIERFHTIK